MMNSKSKKAQIEVSFNWVFVLIAGAIILFFFVRVITTETELTQTASQTRAASRMNAVITALQQNPDSVSVQDRINYEIQFYCDIEGQSYNLKNSNTKQYLPHQIVFSPEIIGESKLITWVRTFKAPMPVASVLYLTDEQTKYVFLTDGLDNNDLIEHYYNLFPDNISKELTDFNTFKSSNDEGYRQYIVILSEHVAKDNAVFSDRRMLSKVKFLSINNNGEIKFYELGKTGQNEYLGFFHDEGITTKYYFTEESIIGAIITGDPVIYECIMNKVLDQVRIIADINVERLKLMHDDFPDGVCKARYSTITQNHFGYLSQHAKSKDYPGLNEAFSKIEESNRQINQAGCPVLY